MYRREHERMVDAMAARLEFREIDLWRIEGHWVDAEGMTWVDNGQRDPSGRRIYTDGAFLAVRKAGVTKAQMLTEDDFRTTP